MDKIKPLLCLMFFVLILGSAEFIPENLLNEQCTGEVIRVISHVFEDNTDSLSGPEIFEVRNQNGLSILFGRYIKKEVCNTGNCKRISLWIFWDGVGNFLGFKVSEDDPLTKSDHTYFEPKDYKKLNIILRDTASVLKTLARDELIVIPDTLGTDNIDGLTSATNPLLSDIVIKDAVYTSHTLWHTVYGPTQKEIMRILDSIANEKYLEFLINSGNPAYITWSLNRIRKSPELHTKFYFKIINLIKSENIDIANHALNYFLPLELNDSVIQEDLIQIMPEVEKSLRYEILWKFIKQGKIRENTLLKFLVLFEEGKLEGNHLRLIYGIVTKEHLDKNKEILNKIYGLLLHENSYVRNVTNKLLTSIVDPVELKR